jgi:hypothetical protein
MLRAGTVALLIGLLGTMPAKAQDPPPEEVYVADDAVPAAAPAWDTVWGVVGLRAIPAGARMAPNGLEYHPNFSIDLGFNFWIWRSQGLYIFANTRLWGETGEFGVTNAHDGALGTSKREFDLDGGVAWNYAGPLELRAFGYTNNNLNRGFNLVAPAGFTDGFGIENRYYLSPEYARLGQTGFDVARASFVSIGYLPSKDLVGNDGQQFYPGLMIRGYATCDLGNWPCYVYGDATYLGDQSFQPRLLILDAGLAARPLRSHQQWELRLGAESTADLQVHNSLSLWYVSVRFNF